jgi:hypothetical protein
MREHERFFGTRAAFGGTWDGYTLPRSALEIVPRNANPALSAFLEMQLQTALKKLPEQENPVEPGGQFYCRSTGRARKELPLSLTCAQNRLRAVNVARRDDVPAPPLWPCPCPTRSDNPPSSRVARPES